MNTRTKKFIVDVATTLPVTAVHKEAVVLAIGDEIALPLEVARLIDSGEMTLDNGIFFARQLETIRATAFEEAYPELRAREIFATTSEAGAGAKTFTYRIYGQTGKAKIINGKASDLPRADINGRESTIKIVTLGIEYGYDLDEIESAQKAQVNLDQRRANAAMKGSELTIDELAWYGNADAGIIGFFSDGTGIPFIEASANFPVTGTKFTGLWATTGTPATIVNDINGLFSEVWTSTNMVERASKLVVSTAVYNLLFDTARSPTATSDTTIAKYIVNNSQFLKSTDDIISVNELAIQTGTAGVPAELAGENVVFVYDPSADKVQLHVPMELTYAAAQPRGLEVAIPGRSKCGGLAIYKPRSAYIGVVGPITAPAV